MPTGIPKNGFNKGWFKKRHRINIGRKCRKSTRMEISNSLSGEKHFNWKGGKILDVNGYILIKTRDHPFANVNGYIFEHRFIMEKHIGRYLSPEEVVHHINGIVTDNRIENLRLFKNDSEHMSFHKTNTKFTYAQVLKIKNLYQQGEINQRELAKMFNVHRDTIWKIINDKTWKDITITTPPHLPNLC